MAIDVIGYAFSFLTLVDPGLNSTFFNTTEQVNSTQNSNSSVILERMTSNQTSSNCTNSSYTFESSPCVENLNSSNFYYEIMLSSVNETLANSTKTLTPTNTSETYIQNFTKSEKIENVYSSSNTIRVISNFLTLSM